MEEVIVVDDRAFIYTNGKWYERVKWGNGYKDLTIGDDHGEYNEDTMIAMLNRILELRNK